METCAVSSAKSPGKQPKQRCGHFKSRFKHTTPPPQGCSPPAQISILLAVHHTAKPHLIDDQRAAQTPWAKHSNTSTLHILVLV